MHHRLTLHRTVGFLFHPQTDASNRLLCKIGLNKFNRVLVRRDKGHSSQLIKDALNDLNVPVWIGSRLLQHAHNIHCIVKRTAIQSERFKHFLKQCYRPAIIYWINNICDLPMLQEGLLLNLYCGSESAKPVSRHSFKLSYKHQHINSFE